MRVVFDSNVWVAAFATAGTSRDAVLDATKGCEVAISPFILDEVDRAMQRKIRLAAEERQELQRWLKAICLVVDPPPRDDVTCRDPDDLPILWLALAVHADRLVTGDRDLLDIKTLQGIKIIPPAQFWQ